MNYYPSENTKIDCYLLTKKAQGASRAGLATGEYAIRHFIATGGTFTKQGVLEWTCKRIDEGMKPVTINHYLKAVRAFVYWCNAEYDDAPFKIKLVKEDEVKPKCFADDDLQKILVKPKKDDSYAQWRTWAIINFILATGCRARTLINIAIDDIEEDRVIFRATKNHKMQVLPLSPSAQSALYTWYKYRKDSKWLFPSNDGYQLTYSGLSSSFERYCNARGVKQHNIHGLRHSFASIAVKSGMNVMTLKEWLGHSDISITQAYVHLFTDDLRNSTNPLDIIKNK